MAANTLLSIGEITKKSLEILENTLTFTKFVNRDYQDQFGNKSAQVGDTISIRVPPRYTTTTGSAFTPQGTTEGTVPLTLIQYNNGISFTSKQLTLDINDFSQQVFMDACIASIANTIDATGMQLAQQVYQMVGTPGTTPTAVSTIMNAKAKLMGQACPADDGLSFVMDPFAEASFAGNAVTYFNPTTDISDQYRKGTLGTMVGGFKTSMDQNVYRQITGTYAATASGAGTAVTLSGDITSGTSVATTGWTSGDTLNVGDIFHIANVYAVNPQSRQSTGQLQQFVVATTPTPAAGGGTITFTVSPSMTFTGQFQNVYATANKATSGAVVTVEAASAVNTPQNLAFHKNAFTFASVPLVKPFTASNMSATYRSPKLNIAIRGWMFGDGFSDTQQIRFDVMGGWAVTRPELACRIAG